MNNDNYIPAPYIPNPNALKVRLTKLSSGPNHSMRTESMEGVAPFGLPTPGMRFVVYGDPLAPEAHLRGISTSPVNYFSQETGLFRTRSGTLYRVEVLQTEPRL